MATLFIDTTKSVTLGVLNAEYNWLSYNTFEGVKGSAILHFKIYDELKKLNLEVSDIQSLVTIAGPGSYTGMRVSEGLKQIFKSSDFNCYSLYHYQIPALLDIEEGHWICDAFKGQYFIHSWKKGSMHNELVDLEKIDTGTSFYSSSDVEKLSITRTTTELLYENPSEVFSKVIANNMNEKIYYFRSLQQEFGASP